MSEWCKIIVVDGQQVLFWIDWSTDEDNGVALHQQATNGRIQIDRKLTFKLRADAPDEELVEFQRRVMGLCDETMARHVLSTVAEYTP